MFPNLTEAKTIAIDTETCDPHLKEMGPGAIRKDGFICGLAVATGPGDGEQWYFPMRHESGRGNMDPDMVLQWARDNLTDPRQDKLGTHLMYDLQWLASEGVRVQGKNIDVLIAEPLIDENHGRYSLDRLGHKYVGEGKDDKPLYEYLAEKFGGKATREAQGRNIWRAPADLVAPYAKSDVWLPFLIFEEQKKLLKAEELEEVFDLETRLVPMLLAMRESGVRVDIKAAQEFDDQLAHEGAEGLRKLDNEFIACNAPSTIAAYCDRMRIPYPLTNDGAPSFQKKWLERHEDLILNEIAVQRGLTKHKGTFIKAILEHEINGRIHAQFNQLKSDEYGSVSGRFSSSNPNLQNIPIRNPQFGPRTRALFLPEEGEDWYSDDWSQIEYKFLVHFSAPYGGEKIIQRYNDDPNTDIHNYVSEIGNIIRDDAKSINFGLVYGMGEPTMALNMGRPLHEVKPIFETYHRELPFVRRTFDAIMKAASKRGFIRTMSGRRRRYETWEHKNYKKAKENDPMSYDDAVANWGRVNIKRAKCFTAANALFQGSAADAMKKAMVDIWEAGICDVLGAPLITVHDELNFSVPRTDEGREAHDSALKIMETCVELRVPLKVDSGSGANWSEAH
jgi:DNA polymerase I-like protein with 3'-5' exonuclease and polymerase domains